MNYNDELLRTVLGLEDMRGKLPTHSTKRWSSRNPANLRGVCYHQSLDDSNSVEGLAKYHVGPNHISNEGLPGISYTMVVDREGAVYLANHVEDKTLSQGDAGRPGDENEEFLAVCFLGNFSGPGYAGTQSVTNKQLMAAQGLWQRIKKIWSFYNNQLFGHYDFGKPACPGYSLQRLIEDVHLDEDWPVSSTYKLNTTDGKQQALKALGYYAGKIDGIWGPACRRGLAEFQKTAGLFVDGVWGKLTSIAIKTALGEKA